MRDLVQMQNHFQHYLLQQQSSIENEILSTEKVPAHVRLDIYRHAYYARLLEILQLDYPALHTLLGDEEFFLLGKRYILAYPSHFRSVRWFGGALPTFLQTMQPYADKPVLKEMAAFEWVLTEVFDSPDHAILQLEKMAEIPHTKWPEMRFKLSPAVRRMDFCWNIISLWNAIKADNFLEPVLNDESTQCLIWRRGYEVQFCSLSSDEAFMIDSMCSGKNFGEICEGLGQWVELDHIALHAASLLKRYIMDGLIFEIYE